MNIRKTLGSFLVVGLMAPAPLLLAHTPHQPANAAAASTTSMVRATANVRNTFSRIWTLAHDVKKEVAPLKFDANRTTAAWKDHSATLAKVKRQVNRMQKDIKQLSAMELKLSPWQLILLSNIKTGTDKLACQTQTAKDALASVRNPTAHPASGYSRHIDAIYRKANAVAVSIGTVFRRYGAYLG